MLDAEQKVRDLIALNSESEIVEFKEAKTSFSIEEIGQYFSALSNEANLKNVAQAWLVFGVKDTNHSFVNSRFRSDDAKLQNLKFEISRHTSGSIGFLEIYAFEAEPSKRVVMFEIPAAPLGYPVSFKGHFYAREHESLVALSIEKIHRIRAQRPNSDWSIQTVEGATLKDLQPDAIAKARESYKVKHPEIIHEVDTWDNRKFLNKSKLCINGRVTNAAILLLGRPEAVHHIGPAVSKISWILKSADGVELDYEHFTSPLILSVDQVYRKIRNLKYRYLKEGSLFPEEVSTYEPYIIREALNNCIAHQDYTMSGKINVVENEDSTLVFSNSGTFLPGSVENVIKTDAPSEYYRNQFLSDAMVNLNMIDTIGSGIRKMFISQKNRYFPLPDYDLSHNQVKVTIIGKVLDIKYARKLAQVPALSLEMIMLLDKVQKKKPVTALEARQLREADLIEGKRPNVYISSKVARRTNEKSDYMKHRGLDDGYCKKMIVDYLREFGRGGRADFEAMLMDKLSDTLNDEQKKNKIRNLLQSLKSEQVIERIRGTKSWQLAA